MLRPVSQIPKIRLGRGGKRPEELALLAKERISHAVSL
jgi:hypothetical protein